MEQYIEYDFSQWIYRYLNGKKQIPLCISGVYVFVDVKKKMGTVKYLPLYVGSSKNLRTRLSYHELYKEFIKNFDNVDCYYIESETYKYVEELLIKKLRPIFNYQFNQKNYLRHG